MNRAKILLDVELMNAEDRHAYQRHIKNRCIEKCVIETAVDKRLMQVAQESLKLGLPMLPLRK